jgi:drug/metabolite transporter (DMT)-like permease
MGVQPVSMDRSARHGARLTGTVLVSLSVTCFGSSGASAKAALASGLSPLSVAQARIALSAVVLLVAVAVLRPGALRVRRAEVPLLLAYGLLAFCLVQTMYILALSRLPVAVAMLLEYLAPVLVALWVRVVRRTRLPRSTWLGATLALTGLALVVQVWRGFRLDALGLVFGLASACALASYFLLSERGLSGRDPLGLVACGAVIGLVPLALLGSWRFPFEVLDRPVTVGALTVLAWAPLLWLALVGTTLAYLLGVAALRHLPAPVVSVLSTVEVLVAAGIAWALLGESLTPTQLAGGAVLLAGVVVVQLRWAVQLTPPEPHSPRADQRSSLRAG